MLPSGVSSPSLQSLTALVAHLVWVDPPNRVNYTVIRRIRNVRRHASAKCSTNCDGKCRGKVQFPKMARRVIPSEVEESRRKTYNDSTGSFDSAALRRDDTSFRQAGLLA